jgi:hypothetical protein
MHIRGGEIRCTAIGAYPEIMAEIALGALDLIETVAEQSGLPFGLLAAAYMNTQGDMIHEKMHNAVEKNGDFQTGGGEGSP